MKMKPLLVSTAAALMLSTAFTACSPSENNAATPKITMPVLGDFGIDLSNIDESIKPGDDFFTYVNGKWLERTEIPDDRSAFGAFHVLSDQAQDRVRAIIEETASGNHKKGSSEQKIGDLYSAFMDIDAINAAGLTPVEADLAAIRELNSHSAIIRKMADPGSGLTTPLSAYVYIDRKAPTKYITYAGQGGLGMPGRDYYLDADEEKKELRAAYKEMLMTMLEKAGVDNAEQAATEVLKFESRLAKVHWESEKRREKELTYNKMSISELKTYAPGIDWDAMLTASGLGSIDEIVLRENTAVKGTAKVFAQTDIETLKNYMMAHYLGDMSPYLSEDVDRANFAFYDEALNGIKEQRPRWKRGVSVVSGTLGEAIGEVYVRRHFPEESKTQMRDLVENLRATFKEGIDNLEWMSAETKVEAQYKLAKFNPKIGYPDKWTDYSTLKVDRDDLIGTVKSAQAWEWNDMVSDLGKPINRDEWGMTPQTVNAYYSSSLNEIVFPAGILDAPFFDPNADPAVNYGGIGAVIGHEMGHGFDDQGRKTDGDGKERDWWTEEDAEAFTAKAQNLVAQYDSFKAFDDLNLKGQLTLGENIGDLTGVTMAYKAYKRSLNGKEAPVIDGLTGDQRFFLAYGQIWQGKMREKAMRAQIETGVHSLGKFRVNGIVRNFDPWYEAFDVNPGDALYIPPEKRVKIW